MKTLINMEFYKLLRLESYKCLFAICFLIALSPAKQQLMGIVYTTGYEWFCVVQLMGGMLVIPVCFFSADYVASDYSNCTFTSSLCCGLTREQIFGAKVIVYLVGLMPLFLVNTITGTITRTIQYGFGAELHSTTFVRMAIALIYYILTYPLVIGMLFFLCAIVTQNRTATIGFGIGTVQLLGSVTSSIGYRIGMAKDSFGKKIGEWLFQFNPLYQIHSLIKPQIFKQIPLSQFVLSTVVWFLFLFMISMYVFKRSDFKSNGRNHF